MANVLTARIHWPNTNKFTKGVKRHGLEPTGRIVDWTFLFAFVSKLGTVRDQFLKFAVHFDRFRQGFGGPRIAKNAA